MERKELLEKIFRDLNSYSFYKDSVKLSGDAAFFMGKDSSSKYLFIVENNEGCSHLKGELLGSSLVDNKQYYIKKAPLSNDNLAELKKIFPEINPVTCKAGASFGTGDRLGMVTAAHVEAFESRDIFPVLAQQSAREISRTRRNWNDVMSSAIWGYFESGSCMPFGADADHIKEEKDLKEAVDAGFTMFTADPSDHIQNTGNPGNSQASQKYSFLENRSRLEEKYLNKIIKVGGKEYFLDEDTLIPIAVKYMKAIRHVSDLYHFLKFHKKDGFDFEVSMDEIEEPVTPLEHYFISRELMDSGVRFGNLALRYPGRWEKAIDYIGDPGYFRSELAAHVEVSKMFGGYKLSLHSGSEKTSVYNAFSEITEGNFHIKTAGTSYLEALRTVSGTDCGLFREIYSLSLESFEADRDSYHLTTDISKLRNIDEVDDNDLKDYLDIPGSRQILHVAFGSVLTDSKLKEKFLSNLFKNEDLHYRYVRDNIVRHLKYLW